jgi:hypothetical protein
MRKVLLLGALLALGAGCGSKASSADDGGVDAPGDALPRVCVPGRAVACTGPAGCAGGQVCVANGTGYGPCDCGYDGAIDDGSAGDAVVLDDAGTGDASPDIRIDDGPPAQSDAQHDAAPQRDAMGQADSQLDGAGCGTNDPCCAYRVACYADAQSQCAGCNISSPSPACTTNDYFRAYFCCFMSQPGFVGCCLESLDCYADASCAPCMTNPTVCNGSVNQRWQCFNLCTAGSSC